MDLWALIMKNSLRILIVENEEVLAANLCELVTDMGYLVVGPVANDTLYQTLTLYEVGILTKKETIARLKVHTLFDQVSFHSHKALEHLKFRSAYPVKTK